mgnify:CR=1 FL=1
MVMDLFGKVYEPYYFPGFAQKMEEQPDFVSKLNYLNLHAAESGMKLTSSSTNTITLPTSF